MRQYLAHPKIDIRLGVSKICGYGTMAIEDIHFGTHGYRVIVISRYNYKLYWIVGFYLYIYISFPQ